MITSITIDGLRGIRRGEVAGLSGLSLLVGPNGCGKSTVLDALLIAVAPNVGAAICRVITRRAEAIVGETRILSPRWLAHQGPKNATIEVGVAGIAAFSRTRLTQAPGDVQANTFAGPLDSRVASATVLTELKSCRVGQDSSRPGAPEVTLIDPLEDVVTPLHLVYSDAARVGRVAFANEVLRALLPRFTRLEILTEGATPILYMHLGEMPVPVSLAGEGVLALVRTVLELAACADGGLALLEEPEVHQHPRSLRLMAQGICAAVRRGVQIILTTHSLELVEALLHFGVEAGVSKDTSVHLVRLRDSELTATRVDGERARFQIQEIGEDLR